MYNTAQHGVHQLCTAVMAASKISVHMVIFQTFSLGANIFQSVQTLDILHMIVLC